MSDDVSTNLGKVPNPLRSKEKIYSSLEEQKLAHQAIFRAYFGGQNEEGSSGGLFIKYSRVQFTKKLVWKIEFDIRNRGVIFWFEEPEGTPEEVELLKKKISYNTSMDFATKINESTKNYMDSLFLSLVPAAQKKLVQEEKEQQKSAQSTEGDLE